jgi:hypothetical protein
MRFSRFEALWRHRPSMLRSSPFSRHPGEGRDPRQAKAKRILLLVSACAGMTKRLSAAVVVSMASFAAHAATLNGLAVDVANQSEPVLCAEKDNVTLALASPQVKSFRIEAAHPAYIGALQRDSFEADWTACDLSGDPVHKSSVGVTTRRTLYEEPALWVVGWTFPTYWRPSTATVRVGDRIEKGLHMLQIWTIRPMGGEEVLILYPQDGYWRIRPKAPQGAAPTAFGSSFLIGPVEVEGRPIVKISDVAIDPKTQTLTVTFSRGGSATVKIAAVDQNKHTLDVNLSAPVAGLPFAMLRSMYVTDFNNDVARVAVREPGAAGWREDGIMTFKGAKATDIWAGRSTISRHNSSSPDMVFGGFSDKARP